MALRSYSCSVLYFLNVGTEENPSYVRCDKDGVRRCPKRGTELRQDGTCPSAWYTEFGTEVHGQKIEETADKGEEI